MRPAGADRCEMIACSGDGGNACSSLRAKPARRNIRSSSAKVWVSPVGVQHSITRLKAAGRAGETRSSFGTNSTETARPPSASAAHTLASSLSQVGGSK